MPNPLTPGLYEHLITTALEPRLAQLRDRLVVHRDRLHPAEAADRIALHLARAVERAIDSIPDAKRPDEGLRVARELLALLERLVAGSETGADVPVETDPVLRAILANRPDGRPATIESPIIPLLDTTLLTNAPGEPNVGHQLKREIQSADRIDVLMAFIRKSGIKPLLDDLRRHCEASRELRVLTTTYTNSTQPAALDLLRDAGAQVRVSYDNDSTRLHAKAWLFHRRSGYSTGYVGSSNLTYSAQVTGLEWNVRVSGARNRDVIEKIDAVFETYWESDHFKPYDAAEFLERTAQDRQAAATVMLSPIELRPKPFQERMLEQIAVARRRGRHRNLLVSATGTGKTVMAALDYARLRDELPRARVLFVAHRQEILHQSRATFCHALRDPSFGEMWVGGERPERHDHVFASIQSLHATTLEHLDPDHFDIVIVDEFHHAAARSYRQLLERIHPRELLGLTATPERADDLSILQWFDGRIAAELRLWDAIDQQLLSPFSYFGLHDGADLTQIPWRRGRGYDVEGLSNLYTANDAWARFVVKSLDDHVDDIGRIRALGFCVSVEHARYMARVFNAADVRSVAVTADTPDDERKAALDDLRRGELRVLFSVDLFNEGVDLPRVDTLLLMRPTDSPTLFLQQLGRGLRRDRGKASCTVLDFVGHHRTEFRFDRRFRALFGGTRREVIDHIQRGFPFLPAGCQMQLDRKARDIVLRSIREAVPSRWPQKVEELRAYVESGREPRLQAFLEHSGLELGDVYTGKYSWSDLCEAAGVTVAAPGPHEAALRRAVGRLLHVDDEVRLSGYLGMLGATTAPAAATFDRLQARLARMLVGSIVGASLDKHATLQNGLDTLWDHPQVVAELRDLFATLRGEVDHLHVALEGRDDVPLQVHARYSRVEILAAFGVGQGARVEPWQTGVRWLPKAKADLFAFTLDKSDGNFSPTTRYRDYALSRELIHWESQSVVREASPTGKRYRNHEALGSEVMLFARLRQSDRAFWFLGPATYERHEGERPMAVVWQLRHPLPGDLFAVFAAAVG